MTDLDRGWGFARAASRLATEAVARYALSARVLPASLSSRDGTWKDQPVRLTSRVWTGTPLRWLRIVNITGDAIEISNVVAIPAAGHPIFGADLVSARPGQGLVVADISPRNRDGQEPPVAGLPDWAAGIFSSAPLMRRVTRDDAAAALDQVMALFRSFLDDIAADGGTPIDGDTVSRYMRAHRSDERTLSLLEHLFGAVWAAEFLERVLYPLAVDHADA